MKKPNITKGEWLFISAVQAGWDKTTYTVGVFEGDVLRTIATVFKQKDAKPISAVPEMIDALTEARKAIMNAKDDVFGFSEAYFGDGKLIKYPLKDEILNNIDKALKKAGCNDE